MAADSKKDRELLRRAAAEAKAETRRLAKRLGEVESRQQNLRHGNAGPRKEQIMDEEAGRRFAEQQERLAKLHNDNEDLKAQLAELQREGIVGELEQHVRVFSAPAPVRLFLWKRMVCAGGAAASRAGGIATA